MSFVFFDCCSTGSNDAMAMAFLPVPDCDPNPGVTDCAEMGWYCEKQQKWSQQFTPALYQYLANEATVGDALGFAWGDFMKFMQDPPAGFPPLYTNPDGSPDENVAHYLTIYCDTFTRMHGLYNGQSGPVRTSWYTVQ